MISWSVFKTVNTVESVGWEFELGFHKVFTRVFAHGLNAQHGFFHCFVFLYDSSLCFAECFDGGRCTVPTLQCGCGQIPGLNEALIYHHGVWAVNQVCY